jgi:hypothetical protein
LEVLMKKWLLIGGIAFVVVLGVALVSGAFFAGQWVARAQAPTETPFGFGHRGGGWMMGGDSEIHDAMQTAMHTAVAEKLGLTVEELDAQIAEGKTAWQIAQEKGLTDEEITTLMSDARTTALTQLVSDGVLTQEQADAMAQHGIGRMGGRGGAGDCPMMDGNDSTSGNWGPGGMMRGKGMGGNR